VRYALSCGVTAKEVNGGSGVSTFGALAMTEWKLARARLQWLTSPQADRLPLGTVLLTYEPSPEYL